jgi:hypothetical protein
MSAGSDQSSHLLERRAGSQRLDCLKLARTNVVDSDPDPLVRGTAPDPAHAPDPDPDPSIIKQK